MTKLKNHVYGIGINDLASENVADTQAYKTWSKILYRSHIKKGSDICEKWKIFSCFKEWYDANHIEGALFTKGLATKATCYSPDFCGFAPRALIQAMKIKSKKAGELPHGVSVSYKRFKARISIDGKSVALGTFETPEEAHTEYAEAKQLALYSYIKKNKSLMSKSVYDNVMKAALMPKEEFKIKFC